MGKTAFIFPGQGSQYVGMGKEFFENHECAKQIFYESYMATGVDSREICFTENDKINQTRFTQIAMFTTEVAMLKVIEEKGLKADITAGLSLGEYAALMAANVSSFDSLCRLVNKRGNLMQDAYPVGGAMTAVLGLDADKVEEICESVDGDVFVANYNCPGQFVITGEEGAVMQAGKLLSENGAKRCIPLKVSGPFHSPLLKKASDGLVLEMESMEFNVPSIPYYSNVEATKVESNEGIKELLAKQVISPVKFMQSVEKMINDGVDTFVEIGPGKTLSGFIGRIDKSVKVINVDKYSDLEKIDELIGGKNE